MVCTNFSCILAFVSLVLRPTSQWMEVMVGLTLRPLYLRGKRPRSSFYRRLCGPQSRAGFLPSLSGNWTGSFVSQARSLITIQTAASCNVTRCLCNRFVLRNKSVKELRTLLARQKAQAGFGGGGWTLLYRKWNTLMAQKHAVGECLEQ